jgi:hypothetical protein
LYAQTQKHITALFQTHLDFGIQQVNAWTWQDILQTQFYTENKALLDQKEPHVNGRAYKPFVILEALKSVGEEDFVIYTDSSPEIWMEVKEIAKEQFSVEVLQQLCVENQGILTSFVSWEAYGDKNHTHENFTTEQCMQKMGCLEYRYCLQHASGMIVLQKSAKTMKFMEDWLRYNCDPECAGFDQDEYVATEKIGHRHDQSISGLLVNKMGGLLIKPVKPIPDLNLFNLLQYARTGDSKLHYEFIPSVQSAQPVQYRRVYDPVTDTYPVHSSQR